MKKMLALILVVAMTLCLTACDLDLDLNQDQDTILSEPAKEDNKNPGKDEGTKDDDVVKDSTNATGIRQEFKDAMDAYEAFYDEYCDILKKYYDNPADMTILAEYTKLMTKAVEMDEAFAKWENEDLNNEELKYYLDVNNRVMQKMLDVMG